MQTPKISENVQPLIISTAGQQKGVSHIGLYSRSCAIRPFVPYQSILALSSVIPKNNIKTTWKYQRANEDRFITGILVPKRIVIVKRSVVSSSWRWHPDEIYSTCDYKLTWTQIFILVPAITLEKCTNRPMERKNEPTLSFLQPIYYSTIFEANSVTHGVD